ncbi:hypothetical protein ACFPM1_08045 [Halorubrum rubrum]|uniref:Uncharacterized protein n=1 Tax=Halorubrum rubrum TaxID=1126240 RepID=A0ABD5R164_9EURY|nr:hypothetical protein [Halorubrum rubrum]
MTDCLRKETERVVNIDDQAAEVLDDYIEAPRQNVTDDYGREPLITTSYGRITLNPPKELLRDYPSM